MFPSTNAEHDCPTAADAGDDSRRTDDSTAGAKSAEEWDRLPAEIRLVERVAAELARDFGGPMRLRDIASANGYNVYQLIRAFRRSIGTTPHAYMMRLRIDYAAIRLAEGDTIAGAAAEAGFADQSHMTRHFKRVFGTTPGRFMRAARARGRILRDARFARATQQGLGSGLPEAQAERGFCRQPPFWIPNISDARQPGRVAEDLPKA